MVLNKLFLGVGLRTPHYRQVLEKKPKIDWFEVHSENFFFKGGYLLKYLNEIRRDYQLSLHGIGLSLGSCDGIDYNHLKKVKSLIDRFDPFLVSDHLSWSGINGNFLPDLLPLPYNKESLDTFVRNIKIAQDFLGREILIENPSSYLEYKTSDMTEYDFLNEISARSGCKILLDVNNVYVSSFNHGWEARSYIENINKDSVKEIHLSGHSTKVLNDKESGKTRELKIDTHDNYVCDEVWDLYKFAIERFGHISTLLEWDGNLPKNIEELLIEVRKAEYKLQERLQESEFYKIDKHNLHKRFA